jgi:hypothetical protein
MLFIFESDLKNYSGFKPAKVTALANTGAAEAADRSRHFMQRFPFLKQCLYRLCREAAPVCGLGNDRLV